MGVVLPIPVGGTAAGWQLVDFRTVRLRSEPAAGGLAVVDFGQLDGGELWLVDHAVVSCDSTTATACRWYEGGISDMTLIDGTSTGNFDVADWPNGLQVSPSQSLVVAWSGASNGARGIAAIQVRVMRR